MKRCPECCRDYFEESLLYCLDDGTPLLDGLVSVDEPVTALLHSTASPAEAATRAQKDITNPTAVLSPTVSNFLAPDRYAVSSDGQRFLVNSTSEDTSQTSMTLILNWTSGLQK